MRGTLLAFVMAAGLVVPAGAQINPFGPYSTDNLNAEDRRLAEEAASKVYRADPPSIGAEQAWANSGSGNSGTITLIRVHDYQGLPCRTLEHRIKVHGRNEPIVFHIDRCRTAAGEWKIL